MRAGLVVENVIRVLTAAGLFTVYCLPYMGNKIFYKNEMNE